MKKITLSVLSILFLSTISFSLFAQSYDFGFRRNDSIEIQNTSGAPYQLAWTGGLNSVHFQQIDLNLDGKLDLVGFDKHGDRLMPFVNIGNVGESKYKYSPQYEGLFPVLVSWVQFHDYNSDGKKDIFTYYPGGIAVYKNTSTVSSGLSFTLVTNMINSDHGGGIQTNLYCGPTDFPAITDIDNDGDLDVLNFGVLGTFIDYHKNLSKELYGNTEQLVFKRVDKCWGKFAENENSNSVTLNLSCNYKSLNDGSKSEQKHVGSTLLAIDLNGDSIKDLLLGDVDFFNIKGLINGGTVDSALIVSQDSLYPSTDTSVHLVSFPSATYFDVDNDGKSELIVAPFEDVYNKPSGKDQIWLYDNIGTNNQPNFKLIKKNFIQDQMIDVGENASPTVVDINNDGLMDIIIGNYGTIDSVYFDPLWNILYTHKSASLSYLMNIGTTTQPKFKLISEDWSNIKSERFTALKPSFGDLDGDGDKDLILGKSDGSLVYYHNNASPNSPISLASPIVNYQAINVGEFSAPQLFDINKDSLLDLLIGNKKGLIAYYKNTGTKLIPNFTLITDSFGYVQTNDYWNYYNGYSSPYFYYNEYDSLRLFAGAASGNVFYYKNIEANMSGTFQKDSNLVYYKYYDTIYSAAFFHRPDDVMQFIDDGMRTSPVLYDFNNDGYNDILIGNFAGGITYYSGIKSLSIGIDKSPTNDLSCELYPNPANEMVYIKFNDFNTFSKVNIKIFDLPGKLIKSLVFEPTSHIGVPLSDLPSNGIYIIQIQTMDVNKNYFLTTKKLVKYLHCNLVNTRCCY